MVITRSNKLSEKTISPATRLKTNSSPQLQNSKNNNKSSVVNKPSDKISASSNGNKPSDKISTSSNGNVKSETFYSLKKLNSELIAKVKELTEELNLTKQQLLSTQPSTSKCPPPAIDLASFNESTFSETLNLPASKENPSPASNYTSLFDTSAPESFLDCSTVHANTSEKPKLLILGTSMSKDFAEILKNLLPEYSVSGQTYPNGKLATIFDQLLVNGKNFGSKDYILLVGGTNDIPHLYPQKIDLYLESVKSIFVKTNVVFCGIPFMYNHKHLNTNIFATNLYFQSQSSKYGFYFYDSNMFLSRFMFTQHGLHLNKLGKLDFCEKLEKLVLILDSSTRNLFPLKFSHPFYM